MNGGRSFQSKRKFIWISAYCSRLTWAQKMHFHWNDTHLTSSNRLPCDILKLNAVSCVHETDLHYNVQQRIGDV